jgi:hypothetical protein
MLEFYREYNALQSIWYVYTYVCVYVLKVTVKIVEVFIE